MAPFRRTGGPIQGTRRVRFPSSRLLRWCSGQSRETLDLETGVRIPSGGLRYFYIAVVEFQSMEKSIRVELPNGEVWKIQRKVAAKLLAQKISSSSDTDSQAIKLLYLNNPEETAKDLTLLEWATFKIHAERVSEPEKDYESLWLQAETEVEE